jgi:Flp pilus assembly pilin Flp
MLTSTLLRLMLAARTLVSPRDERGQTLAEYSLIITVIAVGLVLLAMMVFRDSLTGAFDAAAGCFDGTC